MRRSYTRAPRNHLTWYQVVLTLTGDLIVLLLFLFFALGRAALDVDVQARPQPPAAPVVSPVPPQAWPPTAQLSAIEQDLTTSPPEEDTRLSVAVQDEQGRMLVSVDDEEPYVLASVSKVYLMAAYLGQVEERGERLGEDDMDLLDPMIRYSDNDTATRVWNRIGGLDGVNDFLALHGLKPLTITEDDAWGTLQASPAEVTELLRLLEEGKLLDPEATQLAMRLLSRIWDEQAWGVTSGTSEATSTVYLKNGWYPDRDGWRVNTAGAVTTPQGTYFVAVFAYPTPTLEGGVELVESVAARINAAMAEAGSSDR